MWMTRWRMCKELQFQAFAGTGQQRHRGSPRLLSDLFPRRMWRVCQMKAATPIPQPCRRAGMTRKTSTPGKTLPTINKIQVTNHTAKLGPLSPEQIPPNPKEVLRGPMDFIVKLQHRSQLHPAGEATLSPSQGNQETEPQCYPQHGPL